MNNKTFLTICIALMAAATASAQGPSRTHDLVPFYEDVRGGVCSTTNFTVGEIGPSTPADTALFNRTFRGQPNPQFCETVLNPDGSQMTLGQYTTIRGRSAVKCLRRGTHTVFSFTGLRPNGVYSIWIVLPDSVPGLSIGVGGIGLNGPYENGFTADADGVGQIGRITPEQDLSIFGHVGQCMLDAPLVFELVYHGDGLLHGGDPGPGYTWVTNARFFYP